MLRLVEAAALGTVIAWVWMISASVLIALSVVSVGQWRRRRLARRRLSVWLVDRGDPPGGPPGQR